MSEPEAADEAARSTNIQHDIAREAEKLLAGDDMSEDDSFYSEDDPEAYFAEAVKEFDKNENGAASPKTIANLSQEPKESEQQDIPEPHSGSAKQKQEEEEEEEEKETVLEANTPSAAKSPVQDHDMQPKRESEIGEHKMEESKENDTQSINRSEKGETSEVSNSKSNLLENLGDSSETGEVDSIMNAFDDNMYDTGDAVLKNETPRDANLERDGNQSERSKVSSQSSSSQSSSSQSSSSQSSSSQSSSSKSSSSKSSSSKSSSSQSSSSQSSSTKKHQRLSKTGIERARQNSSNVPEQNQRLSGTNLSTDNIKPLKVDRDLQELPEQSSQKEENRVQKDATATKKEAHDERRSNQPDEANKKPFRRQTKDHESNNLDSQSTESTKSLHDKKSVRSESLSSMNKSAEAELDVTRQRSTQKDAELESKPNKSSSRENGSVSRSDGSLSNKNKHRETNSGVTEHRDGQNNTESEHEHNQSDESSNEDEFSDIDEDDGDDSDGSLQGEKILFNSISESQGRNPSRARPASAMPRRQKPMNSPTSFDSEKLKQDRISRSTRPKSASLARPKSATPKLNMNYSHGPALQETPVRSAALPSHLKLSSATPQSNLQIPLRSLGPKPTYDQLRRREAGWDTDFTRSHALDEPIRGSGPRAVRKLKKTRSASGRLAPLKTKKTTSSSARLQSSQSSKSMKRRPRSKAGVEVETLCEEITTFWEQLHIPKRDREFFRNTYFPRKRPCNKPAPATLARLREQHYLLTQHRRSTLTVLRAIQKREANLESLLQLVSRISKSSHRSRNQRQSHYEDEQEEEDDVDSNTKDHSNTDADRSSEGDGESQHQEAQMAIQKQMCLVDLRASSIAVVQDIVAWREQLWRPHPFNYLGSNYLCKMQTDAKAYRDQVEPKCRDTVFFTDDKACTADTPPVDVSLKKLLMVVKQEALLQCELRGEHKRLLSAGYYIPMLRWRPDEPARVPGSSANPLSPSGYASGLKRALHPHSQTDERDEDCQEATEDLLESSKQHMHMLQNLRHQIEVATVKDQLSK